MLSNILFAIILMYIYIRIFSMKILIKFVGPILPGSISEAKSQCGKSNCGCKSKQPKLHGPYYRWTGVIKGKRTTKTITKEMASECQNRIDRYRQLMKQIDILLENSLSAAPWESKPGRSR